MSDDDLRPILIDNPYAPPSSDLAPSAAAPAGDLGRAEEVRREYLGHEAAVRSIGSLLYLGAILGGFGIVAGILGILGVADLSGANGLDPKIFAAILTGFYVVMTAIYVTLGYGLRTLRAWARWIVFALDILGLLYVGLVGVALFVVQGPFPGMIVLALGSLIPGYIMYLLVSRKAGVVFSADYKRVIAETPHIRYKTSLIVKVLLAVIGLLFVFGIIAAIMNRGN